jgi:hypothetical protein
MTVILLEGPDGSGKTSTLRAIRQWMPYVTKFERACTSEGGPVPDLRRWVDDRMPQLRDHAARGHEHVVLDRHPLVSELIYGPMVRGSMDEGFEWPWLRQTFQEFARMVVVVWHLPPTSTVERYLDTPGRVDSPGVEENIYGLHAAYQAMMNTWPGPHWLVHDWTKDPHHTRLIPALDQLAPMPMKGN